MRAPAREGVYELRSQGRSGARRHQGICRCRRAFGPTESGMVNAVLDRIAHEERAEELS
jgi:N utilization substance protein B